MSTETITTRTSVYSVRPDGIVVQRNLPGIVQSVSDAQENIAAFNKLADGRPRLLLVDTRELEGQENGVREIYAGEDAMRWAAAVAALSNTSGTGRVLINLFIALSRPLSPTRMFTSEDAALAWLKKIGRLKKLG